jgi:hypothetical protein
MQFSVPHLLTKIWRHALIVLLILISVYELYEAVKFFVIEYPQLELELASHALTEEHITELTSGAIAESLTSALNMFFAVRLFKAHERIMQFLDLIGSSGLVVWHQHVIELFSNFNYVALWERLFQYFF